MNQKLHTTFNQKAAISFYSNMISSYNLHEEIYYKTLVSMETEIF